MSNKIHFIQYGYGHFINLNQSTMLIVNLDTKSRTHLVYDEVYIEEDSIVLQGTYQGDEAWYEYENIEIIQGWKNGF